jgi:hypothetical protein
MFLFLRPPKPPRLRTAKMETKVKIHWKGPVQRRHLLLCFLKTLSWTRRGTSAPKTVAGESFEPEDGGELFDFMDS